MSQTKPAGLARALRVVRAARGLKSHEVEEKAGIRKGYLSQLENGTRTPAPGTLRKIESALSISSTSLLILSLTKEERDKIGEPGVGILAEQTMKELLSWPD